MKTNTTNGKFVKGYISSRRGKTIIETYGEEKAKQIKEKMSLAKKGCVGWNKGKIMSKEARKKMSEAKLRNPSPNQFKKEHTINVGRKHSEEWIEKQRKGKLGTKMPILSEKFKGEGNPMYGKHPWNYGLTGVQKNINKGKKYEEIYGIKHLKVKEKIKISMLEKYAKGEIEPWNKGLKGFMEGEKNGAWMGGLSFEPYTFDFNKRFKEKIKERDGYVCQLCGIYEEDLYLIKKYFIIHHINYDKKLSIPQNCITLCCRCHGLTTFNRDQWKLFFQSLLKEKYDYEYNEKQKIVLDFTDEQMKKIK